MQSASSVVILLLGLAAAAATFMFWCMQLIHMGCVLAWCDQRTKGLNYYGQSLERRNRLKNSLRWHQWALLPILWTLSRWRRFRFEEGCFQVEGVAGPKGTCSEEDFRRAVCYQPQTEDVFVVSQMKSGTTWVQQLVVQVLMRGQQQLINSENPLYAVSPWLESSKSVSVEAAPTVGQDVPSRVIKTHLPTSLCPYSDRAKYIYVARHPVSCFASCVDFVASNLGDFTPPLEDFEAWYCSDRLMWWGTWPAHVGGWWRWSEKRDNVLFLRFEDMKRDLAAIAQQVAQFLGLEALHDIELASVLHNCSFEYMRERADAFEMHPPHLLQAKGKFFVSGKETRFVDVPREMADRLAQWSYGQLAADGLSVVELFPELAQEAS